MRALFVNHLQYACGVYQFFKRMTKPVVESDPDYYYIETNNEWEHDYWLNEIKPEIVVYNFYFSGSTMPWLTNNKVNLQRGRFKQLCLFHEGNIDDKGFDLIFHQNPVNLDQKYFNLPRPIPHYPNISHNRNKVPTVGTFGFGLGGKGFGTLIEHVIHDFDRAHIRMNIPFAHFGDSNGDGARWWSQHCHEILAAHNTPNITLTITHELLPESQLLDFLAANDINAFCYDDNIGRGISGTLDYALAVRRPIAITKSWQFQHMWNDLMLLSPDNGLQEIMTAGIQHLEKYHIKWNDAAMIHAFTTAFEKVMENK